VIAWFGAAFWGAFLLAAMVGWGAAVERVLRDSPGLGWAQRAATGLAFTAVLGGVLDLLAVISRPLMVAFLSIGAGALLYSLVRPRPERSELAHAPGRHGAVVGLALALAALMLAVRMAGTVVVLRSDGPLGTFNSADDFQAYMVYPVKMVEAGSLGADPFSIRRTPTHSYGGGAFLNTLVTAALSVQSVRLVDVGIGSVLIVGLLWALTARLGTTRAAAAFVILVFLLVPPPLINITSLLIPTALFLSLVLLCLRPPNGLTPSALAVLIGLHAGAIGVLKTNLIPAAATFLGMQAAFVVLRSSDKRASLPQTLSWFLAALVAALPWMLDAYRWTGTLLPRGLAAYYADPLRVSAFERVTGLPTLVPHLRELPLIPLAVLAVFASILLIRGPQGTPRAPFWSIAVTALAGSLAIVFAVAGAVNAIGRFMYPFVMSALLTGFAYVLAVAERADARRTRVAAYGIAILSAAAVIVPSARDLTRMYMFSVRTAADSVRGDVLVPPSWAEKYMAMQNTMDPATTVLARMDHPFLFDFGRNNVLLLDMPGSASMAPGMPYFQGSEAVSRYLTERGIRYVAYDYKSQVGTPKEGPLAALVDDDRYPSAQAVVRLTFDLHDNFMDLAQRHERVFDDGTAFVLDLESEVR
jgi:hypothetical protein